MNVGVRVYVQRELMVCSDLRINYKWELPYVFHATEKHRATLRDKKYHITRILITVICHVVLEENDCDLIVPVL